jgi:hypothetical protein
MHQNGDQWDRQAPEDSKPDIDISTEIKTKRLPGGRKKLVNLFRDINGHAWVALKVEISDNYTYIYRLLSITIELPGVTGSRGIFPSPLLNGQP